MTQPNQPHAPLASFEQLVARHQAAVCAVAYSALRDRALSEDVAQEAFLVAWRRLPTLSEPPRMPAWLCGIARGVAANVRRKRRWETTTMDPIEQTSPDATALDQLISHEDEQRAARALAQLGDKYREPLVLFYRGQQSVSEVAAALGISEDTAKQRLSRGRKQIEAQMSSVERALRASRPGVAFTAATVAAYLAGGGASARAAGSVAASSSMLAAPKTLAILLIAAMVCGGGALVWRRADHRAALSPPGSAPNASAPLRPVSGAGSPRGAANPHATTTTTTTMAQALGTTLAPSSPEPTAAVAMLQRRLDLDLGQLGVDVALRALSDATGVPIRIHGDIAANVNLRLHDVPAIDAIDEVLRQAGAKRDQIPALRIVRGPTLEMPPNEGEAVSLVLNGAPLADVLLGLEARLGLPIAVPKDLAGTPVTLRIEGARAARALEQVLRQAGLGCERWIAFDVTPDAP